MPLEQNMPENEAPEQKYRWAMPIASSPSCGEEGRAVVRHSVVTFSESRPLGVGGGRKPGPDVPGREARGLGFSSLGVLGRVLGWMGSGWQSRS